MNGQKTIKDLMYHAAHSIARMKNIRTVLLCLIVLFLQKEAGAQHTVKGQLFADSSKIAVGSANVSLITASDSTIVQIVLSDDKGRFQLKEIANGDYFLLISVLSYKPHLHDLKITDEKKDYIIDSIFLKPSTDTLEAVTVVATRMPVTIKTDTTEFKADAFKTMPNATVEDLLKKLPALQVDKDGNVTAQGEKVTKVLVDGKPFFGGDPQTAIQNLPANIIDKVQVIDEKSEQTKNTKVDDGIREKVLNLTIQKDKKKGYFASANAAYGTDNRYEGAVSANYFKGEKKYSLVGTATNTGRSSFSTPGGESTNFNGGAGLSKDKQIRFSFNDQLNKKFDYNLGLNYSTNENTRSNTRNRQNIFGDSITYYYEESNSVSRSKRLNGNLQLDWHPDTLLTLRVNQSGGWSKNAFESNVNAVSTLVKNSHVLNKSNRNYNNENSSPSFNGSFNLNKRFAKDRLQRSIFISFNNSINQSLAENFNLSNNYFYPLTGTDYARLFNQFTNNTNRFTNISGSVNYNQKLFGQTFMSTGYNFSYSKNTTFRQTFDYNSLSDLYDILNDSLSNRFVNNNYNHSVNYNVNSNWKKGGFGLGLRYNKAITKGRSFSNDSTYRQEFSGITPNANLYLTGKNKRLNLNYNFNIRPPQASQLQPVIDVSNPLFIRLGNPNLKYATTHSVNGNFNYYNNKRELNINVNSNFNYTFNQITNSNVYDKITGQQITQPVNMNGAYFLNGYLNFNIPWKPGQLKNKLVFNASMSYNRNRNMSLTNYVANSSVNENFGNYFNIRWERRDRISISLIVNTNVQRSRYSIQSNLNNNNFYYSFGSEGDIRIGSLTQVKFDYNLRQTTGQSAGFNRKIHLLNASVIQYFNSRRNIWIGVRGFDILKQNVSISRFVGENFIEDFQSNALTRFFLVSLSYKLNRFGGKPSGNPSSGQISGAKK